MTSQQKPPLDPRQFYAQAMYFIIAGEVATKHAQANSAANPVAFHNFEGVIVGTCHGFGIELLLKAYIILKGESVPRTHNLRVLLDNSVCSELKERLAEEYSSTPEKFHAGVFGATASFQELLAAHEKVFEDWRYACEPPSPQLDMNFTSFLANSLKHHVAKAMGM